jgi:tRNA pseudouridine55 synthase
MGNNTQDGFLIVDKPAGISSAGVVAKVKRLTGARKAGHAGTLDPFATGVLVCCLNRAARLSRFFLGGHKRTRRRSSWERKPTPRMSPAG